MQQSTTAAATNPQASQSVRISLKQILAQRCTDDVCCKQGQIYWSCRLHQPLAAFMTRTITEVTGMVTDLNLQVTGLRTNHVRL